MVTIEALIEKYGVESEVVKEAIDEKAVFEARVKGKTWEELTNTAKPWRDVWKKTIE